MHLVTGGPVANGSFHFDCKMVNDTWNIYLPTLSSHLKKAVSGIAKQTLNLFVHSHKWSLTIQGIKGEADEDEALCQSRPKSFI